MTRLPLILTTALAVGAAGAGPAAAATKGKSMSYGDVREFLAKHTQLIELTNDNGARVAVCPEWQGRVMTSTCGGMEGLSFGFVNNEFITAGKANLHFNNFGAEERLWLSPEGGQFSLWFGRASPRTSTIGSRRRPSTKGLGRSFPPNHFTWPQRCASRTPPARSSIWTSTAASTYWAIPISNGCSARRRRPRSPRRA